MICNVVDVYTNGVEKPALKHYPDDGGSRFLLAVNTHPPQYKA
jgi:hypothetical protein